jgi:hypothetical protein
LQQAALQ